MLKLTTTLPGDVAAQNCSLLYHGSLVMPTFKTKTADRRLLGSPT